MKYLYRNWFVAGLILVFFLTLADVTGTVSDIGKWFKMNHGPEIVIVLIFFFSGIVLDASHIKTGLTDVSGLLLALGIMFLVSPLLGMLFGLAPLNNDIKIGVFLVAVMPTTLSSGVVMTGASGGNMAHALLITIVANSLSVMTIPVALSLLLQNTGNNASVQIDKWAIMIQIGWAVLVPLLSGLCLKYFFTSFVKPIERRLQVFNQIFVLTIVWMASSQSRMAIIESGKMAGVVFLTVFLFHGVLVSAAILLAKAFDLKSGRRESVIFMGGQKTLPLSVILQVSLFSQHGLVLVVCVMHHITHLIMDGWLVTKLKTSKPG